MGVGGTSRWAAGPPPYRHWDTEVRMTRRKMIRTSVSVCGRTAQWAVQPAIRKSALIVGWPATGPNKSLLCEVGDA